MLAKSTSGDNQNFFDKFNKPVLDYESDTFIASGYDDESLELMDIDLSNSVGKWKDEYQNIIYHLTKEDKKHFLIMEFNDNSFRKRNLVIRTSEKNPAFEIAGSSSGEYFVLKGQYFEFHDRVGIIDKFEAVS